MNIIDIPLCWKHFGDHIHQDFFLQFPTFENGLIDYREGQVGKDGEARLICIRKFLRQVLMVDLSNNELREIWLNSGASVIQYPDNMREGFEFVLRVLDE